MTVGRREHKRMSYVEDIVEIVMRKETSYALLASTVLVKRVRCKYANSFASCRNVLATPRLFLHMKVCEYRCTDNS